MESYNLRPGVTFRCGPFTIKLSESEGGSTVEFVTGPRKRLNIKRDS